MKKRKSPPKGKRGGPTEFRAKHATVHSGAKPVPAGGDGASAKTRIRYFFGPGAGEEPKTLPRLFMHGPSGGSVKMDLSGVGIELIPGAFSFVVPDDALRSLEIHRGDIALVQPFDGSLEEGQLLVVTAGPEDTIGQVKKAGGTWCLATAFEPNHEPTAMFELPIRGQVIGFLRLFVPTKPVPYRPDDAQFALPSERRGTARPYTAARPKKKGKGAPHPKKGYEQKTRSKPQWLTAETGEKPFLSEVEGSNLYGAPTKTCFK